MDGRERWLDNVFIERLWKTVKYEEVYLRAYESVSAAKASLATYFAFYNARRPHTSLDRMTPDQIYFQALPLPRQLEPVEASRIEPGCAVQTIGVTSSSCRARLPQPLLRRRGARHTSTPCVSTTPQVMLAMQKSP